jgi:hypothetical protein
MKKECIYKSFKADYNIILLPLLIIIGICLFTYKFISNFTIISSYLWMFTPYNIFIISEIISICIIAIIMFLDKALHKDKQLILFPIILISVITLVLWMFYGMFASTPSVIFPNLQYPDLLSTVSCILLINALVISPILTAICRCKDNS